MTEPTPFLSDLPPDLLIRACALMDYMLSDGLRAEDANDVLVAMSERIRAAGIPLDRATSIVGLLHAEAAASGRYWEHGKGVRNHLFPFTPTTGDGYGKSPAAIVHETGEWLIDWLPDLDDDAYDIVADLKAQGYTHYIMAPVFMRSGMYGTFSFATRSETGFSDRDISFLRAVFPALAATQEILATQRAMTEVLRIYVGEEPKKRILSGDVHRGEVMRVRAAILFADMRRFTELTARMEAEDATALLNRYYDCIVPHVENRGGEVLKFIGDGILAIFRAEGDGGDTCNHAVQAARKGLAAVRDQDGEPRFDVGIALHFGEVAFGNVGSGMRLDYTVIGRDVNLAARIAGLCDGLGETLLLSQAVAQRLQGVNCRAAGHHGLKGLDQPQAVFALDP